LVYALYGIFLFLSLAASRSSFRLLDRLARPRPGPDHLPVLILGAGDAGELALRWLLANPALGYDPVGFLDDDPFRIGRSIHGVEVFGRLERLNELLAEGRVRGVILAGIEPASPAGQSAAAACAAHDCWLRSLRLEFELVEKS
jgi:FlaA1/EpsC-like NDP-sugar epimerase